MKKILSLSFVFFLFVCVSAQENVIDLEGVFKGKYRMKNVPFLQWRPNSTQISVLRNDTIFLQNPQNGKESVFLNLLDLQKENPLLKKVNSLRGFYWVNENSIFLSRYNLLLSQTDKGVQVKEYPIVDDEFLLDYNLKNSLFVVKKENNVFVKSELNQYKPIVLCTDTGKNIVFGESVHRNEWGIGEGQYIADNGQYIAFYRMDESMVDDYPLVDITADVADINLIKYPMAGRKNHQVKVGIFDVVASAQKNASVFHYIQTDVNDGEFLTNVTFSPDASKLYIAHLNRAQNHVKWIEYDVKTGQKLRILMEEKDSRYMEPSSRMVFLKNGNFILLSDRDGWPHLYLHAPDGKIISQLTKGEWCVTDFLGLDGKEENIYFVSTNPSPVDRHVYALNIKSKKMIALTTLSGTHQPVFSSDKSMFIDYFSNIETPYVISIYNGKGKEIRELFRADNPYKSTTLGKTTIFTIKNKENIDLYCRMILPPNFDENRKYPCMLYVYGGPHSQLVDNTFMSGGVFLQYLAQKGYVVFTLDNRGTANRGVEFEKCIHRQVGKLEMEDQMCGVDYLKSLSYIDANKIAVDGWSYGGFMTLSLITTYPEVFASATCGGPVVDWKWYEIMYGERYMDTPEENPEGYQNTSIINKIKDLKTPLLVFHGSQDDVVLWKHSQSLINQCIKDGILIDYFIYPNHPHNVSGMDRVHLWRKIENFHQEKLGLTPVLEETPIYQHKKRR